MQSTLKLIPSRLLISLVGIPLVLLCFVKAPPVGFFAFVLVFVALIALELMSFAKLYSTLDKVLMALATSSFVGAKYLFYLHEGGGFLGLSSIPEIALLTIIFFVAYQSSWGIFFPGKGTSKNIGDLAFIFVYAGVVGTFAIEVKFFHLAFPELAPTEPKLAGETEAVGTLFLAYSVLLCFAYDTVAYYVGRPFGRHKLGLKVSPNKSWEGSLSGLFVCVLIHAAFSLYVRARHSNWLVGETFFGSYWKGLAITLFIAASCQFGDLVASLLKRKSGIKDSGKLFFSHGGVVDRTDSVIFAILAAYLLMRFSIGL